MLRYLDILCWLQTIQHWEAALEAGTSVRGIPHIRCGKGANEAWRADLIGDGLARLQCPGLIATTTWRE
jgi:hypothetical protein